MTPGDAPKGGDRPLDVGPAVERPVVCPDPVGWIGLSPRRIVFGLVALAVAGGGLLWWAWQPADEVRSPTEVPLLRAESEPYKVRPEDPGGLRVADRDKLVYRRIGDDEPEPVLERLLPEPEEPQAPPRRKPSPPEAAATPPSAAPRTIADLLDEETTAMAGESVTPMPLAEPEEPPKPEAATPLAPAAETPTEAEPPTAAVEPAYQLQLASVRTAEQASSEWKRISGRNQDLLGALNLDVSQVDLGERGVWFRVRAGPVAGEDRAKAACAALLARKVDCLVIRPGG